MGMFRWNNLKQYALLLQQVGWNSLRFRLLDPLQYLLSLGYVTSFAVRICVHATTIF